MTLDMNYIRNEFAAKITANDGDKGSMDAALFHVAKIAFEQGRGERDHLSIKEKDDAVREALEHYDNGVECALIAGRIDGQKMGGVYSEQDSRTYVSMRESIDKHKQSIRALIEHMKGE
jgi:hypothetical protein